MNKEERRAKNPRPVDWKRSNRVEQKKELMKNWQILESKGPFTKKQIQEAFKCQKK